MTLEQTLGASHHGAVAQLPAVEAAFNYLKPMPERPWTLAYDPPPGTARTNIVNEPHVMTIRDARALGTQPSLDREGFAFIEESTAARDLDDEAELRRVYYPECERLVAAATGANRVIVFDHTIRRRIPGAIDRAPATPRQPVMRVHNDYTVLSGPQRVRDVMGPEADTLLLGRFSIVNVWRPIRGPVRESPLGVCDAHSVAFDDLVAQDLVYRDRTGEIYSVKHSPGHRWYYLSAMRTDEAILLKCYDSAEDGRARFAPHSAFEDPTTPPDNPVPRESIEIRTLAFYPA